MANPVLVEMTRGGHVESRHRGSYVITRAGGDVVAEVGDGARSIFPRSSYKMLQSLALVETGAAEAFKLGPQELSLACASHSSEPMHTTRVQSWLAALSLNDADLACGPHDSRHLPTRDDMIRANDAPKQRHNNCSGKHAGFLTVAKHLGASTTDHDYVDPSHVVQKLVTSAICDMCEIEPRQTIPGTDGCAAPNLAMPLKSLARGFANLANPAIHGPVRAEAVEQLTDAVRLHPLLMSGTDRACADFVEASDGKAIVKVGAEGVYAGFVPHLSLGFALKIDDGAIRAAEGAAAAILVKLGVVSADDPRVRKWMCPPWLNMNGAHVGEQRLTTDLTSPLNL